MKSAYEPVTRWVRFNAHALGFEMKLCNERWMGPALRPFLVEAKPTKAAEPEATPLIEEVASAIWLMQGERDALVRRATELFGPRGGIEIGEEIAGLFERAEADACGVRAALQSARARGMLIEENAAKVDSHTRLLLRKHLIVLNGLITPSLESVAAREAKPGAAAVSVEAFKKAYASFAPTAGRPHPDDFPSASLLAGMGGAHV